MSRRKTRVRAINAQQDNKELGARRRFLPGHFNYRIRDALAPARARINFFILQRVEY